MKVIVNVMAAVALIATIVAGKLYWNYQTPERAEVATSASASSSKARGGSWEDYASNLPEGVVEKLADASETGEPMKLVIVGSQSTSKGENGWPALLTEKLDEAYGEALVDVEVYEYKEMNTLDFVRSDTYEDIVKAQPDVLLFEPFLLNDNGVVGIKNTLENLDVIMTHVTDEVEDVVTILQPSQPIYNAVNYPVEVEELASFAKENNYEFVNHWEAWPDYKSEEILDYLSEDQRQPNKKGHETWAEFLTEYFVAS
ncbi:SGNH/GDSL hydrolase family protein [Priestia megaterium]|nr:SGNH/GDSL hydrolase family protein [Priestia megaterium]